MKAKESRLNLIRQLIKNNKIDSQETLLELLQSKGHDVTQATLSRDLKMLEVIKVPDGQNGYNYIMAKEKSTLDFRHGYIKDIQRGILSIHFSKNIGVIKTQIGHANSVAFAVDNLEINGILGTIAGDDTIFFIIDENTSRGDVADIFKEIAPELF